MNKKEALKNVNKEIEQCTICPIGKTGKIVIGEGSPFATVAFIGEAPGKKEAATGRPFIGRSGQLLRQNIREIGLSEDNVYITSAVKYLPLRGTPSLQDIAHGAIHVKKQLEVIQPKLIVVLGSVAAKALITQPISVSKEHGTVVHENGQKYFISYHPAAALRFAKVKKIFIQDFKKIPELL